jgi:hypothetical protein
MWASSIPILNDRLHKISRSRSHNGIVIAESLYLRRRSGDEVVSVHTCRRSLELLMVYLRSVACMPNPASFYYPPL